MVGGCMSLNTSCTFSVKPHEYLIFGADANIGKWNIPISVPLKMVIKHLWQRYVMEIGIQNDNIEFNKFRG